MQNTKKNYRRHGIFSTLSSYHSHHINTIEGGFLLTDSFDVFIAMLLSLRSHGWSREQPKNSKIGKENI